MDSILACGAVLLGEKLRSPQQGRANFCQDDSEMTELITRELPPRGGGWDTVTFGTGGRLYRVERDGVH